MSKIILILLTVSLSACQIHYFSEPSLPSEAALVANAYQNGLSTELDIDYRHAFNNVRRAYHHCVAFTTNDNLVYTDNRLEEFIELGTIFTRNQDGRYLSKVTLEGIAPNRTRLTLFLPDNYKYPQRRLDLDRQWALGLNQECNKN
ncbi:hypothetical protein EC844_12318 [Acinetobacter calcoaceticus]|uniref:Lipoprotein n=1 Tax=Acinetobacter calcoaceticus TaxID=471 RepID=A0A4R1XG50_ACICA|nr:hypothetical protein EC844_12318 [Acinetobacter calcoaceticus]